MPCRGRSRYSTCCVLRRNKKRVDRSSGREQAMKPELLKYLFGCAGLVLIVVSVNGCSRSVSTAEQTKDRVETRDGVQVHHIPAGKEFAGFLSDYSKLHPSTKVEGNALAFASTDAVK